MSESESEPESESNSVTRCPKCKTAFHIGAIQLDAAGGIVRCGSCLDVFDARDHFIVDGDIPPTESNFEEVDQESEDTGPIILGDYDPDSAPSISREIVQQFVEDAAKDSIPQLDKDSSGGEEHTDTSLQDALDKVNDSEKLNPFGRSSSQGVVDSLFESITNKVSNDPFVSVFAKAETPKDEDALTPSVSDKEQIPEPNQESEIDTATGTTDNESPLFSSERDIDSERTDNETQFAEPEEPTFQNIGSTENASEDEIEEETSSSDYFIRPDTSDYHVDRTTQKKWKMAAGWLLAFLCVELLFWQPETLRKHGWFRAASHTLCSVLPCESKPYLNINEMDVVGYIEPNPELDNILVANIELRNLSNQEQGLPNIELRFVDIRGRTTASRIFKPSEYLQGEARSLTQTPVARPIQIAINFVDPGEQSRSYEIGLIP